jgi:hypothetical protein
MDLDVFGSNETKVVIIGEDNVVIVKDRDEEAVQEEAQAIADIKLESSSAPLAKSTDSADDVILISSTSGDLSTSAEAPLHPKVGSFMHHFLKKENNYSGGYFLNQYLKGGKEGRKEGGEGRGGKQGRGYCYHRRCLSQGQGQGG